MQTGNSRAFVFGDARENEREKKGRQGLEKSAKRR